MQLLNILILVGAIQGFISSLLLYFSKKGRKVSNRLLSAIVLLISMACFNLFLMQSGVRYYSETSNALAYVIPLLIVMPLGPLIYLYAQSLVDVDFKLIHKHHVHFYTIIIDLIPYLAGAMLVGGLTLNLLTKTDERSWRNVIDQYDIYSDILRWISITLYLFLAWRIFYGKQIGNDQPNFRWLKQFIMVFSVFQFLWLLHLIPYLLPTVRDELMNWVDWYPVYLPLAVLVYWLGINGYLRNPEGEIILNRKSIPASSLSPELILQAQVALEESMEIDRLFLDPLLNLEQVAKHIGIPQKAVSAVLNQHLGKSFNAFVNGYRVTELKKRLTESGNEHLSIMGLALECGFNSQATMQRAFKQITQYSPREYQLANKPETTSNKVMNATQIQI